MAAVPIFIPAVVWSYVAKTANYSVTDLDRVVDCTANSFTVTLPTAVGRTGFEIQIKNSGTGVITVATTAAQTIDDFSSIDLVEGESVYAVSNGANWIIL